MAVCRRGFMQHLLPRARAVAPARPPRALRAMGLGDIGFALCGVAAERRGIADGRLGPPLRGIYALM